MGWKLSEGLDQRFRYGIKVDLQALPLRQHSQGGTIRADFLVAISNDDVIPRVERNPYEEI